MGELSDTPPRNLFDALPRCGPVEPGAFETVPVVRLRKRRLLGASGDLLETDAVPRVRQLAAKGPVCVVDLDGLRRNKADLDTLRRMADKGNVWADAGSRFATDAMDLLVAGADRVTLRWGSLADEEELREAHAMSDALLLGLEYEGALVPNPRMGSDEGRGLALARELGLGLVVIDRARAGSRKGVDRGLAARFQASGLERWFTGGVRDREDARELQALGYKGCLVGAAMEAEPW